MRTRSCCDGGSSANGCRNSLGCFAVRELVVSQFLPVGQASVDVVEDVEVFLPSVEKRYSQQPNLMFCCLNSKSPTQETLTTKCQKTLLCNVVRTATTAAHSSLSTC